MPTTPNKGGNTGNMSQTPENRRRSGMFTNIQKYIEANSPQTSRVASRIEGGIKNDETDALNKLAEERAKFEDDIKGGAITEDVYGSAKGAAKRAVGAVSSEYDSGEVKPRFTGIFNSGNTAETVIPSDEEKEAAKRVLEGYKGPTGTDGRFQDVLGRGQRAEEQARRTASEEGRMSLLSDYWGRPNYATGERRLDNVLLGGDQGSKEKFVNLQQQMLGENRPTAQIEAGREAALGTLSSTMSASQQYAQDYSNFLQSSATGIQGNLNQRLQEAQQQYQSRYDQLVKALAASEGLKAVEGGTPLGLYGVNPYDLIGQGENVLGRDYQMEIGDVLSEQDVIAANALSELSGGSISPQYAASMIKSSSNRVSPSQLGVNWQGAEQQAIANRNRFFSEVENLKPDAILGTEVFSDPKATGNAIYNDPEAVQARQAATQQVMGTLDEIVAREANLLGANSQAGESLKNFTRSANEVFNAQNNLTSRITRNPVYGRQIEGSGVGKDKGRYILNHAHRFADNIANAGTAEEKMDVFNQALQESISNISRLQAKGAKQGGFTSADLSDLQEWQERQEGVKTLLLPEVYRQRAIDKVNDINKTFGDTYSDQAIKSRFSELQDKVQRNLIGG